MVCVNTSLFELGVLNVGLPHGGVTGGVSMVDPIARVATLFVWLIVAAAM